jgi:hypothetical protein
MSIVTRHGDTCQVKNASNGKTVVAEIMSFNEARNITVVMNKSVKLLMNWNGRVYEGRMAGLDFVTDGPKLTKTQTTSRG